jgi:hypothetical protein
MMEQAMPAGGKPYPKSMNAPVAPMTAKKPPKKGGKKGKS